MNRRAMLLSGALAVSPLTTSAMERPIARVSVLANGKLLLNDRVTSIAELTAALGTLKKQRGLVWYYRENANAEPTAQATEVINLIVEYQLPVSMSSKADFADYIDENGQSRPRQPQVGRR
jgi:hypothetical protein